MYQSRCLESVSAILSKKKLLKTIRNLSKSFVACVAKSDVQVTPSPLHGQPWALDISDTSEGWGSWPTLSLEQLVHSTSSTAMTYNSYCHVGASIWNSLRLMAVPKSQGKPTEWGSRFFVEDAETLSGKFSKPRKSVQKVFGVKKQEIYISL